MSYHYKNYYPSVGLRIEDGEMIKKITVNEILKWIELHLEEHITVEDTVKFSGFSRRHLYTIFKGYTGFPIGKYIRKRKLCRAAYKLKLTSLSVAQIACSLEFDSQQSFCREFKKLFGKTPKDYRNEEVWDMSHLQFPLQIETKQEIPEIEICNIQENKFYGYEIIYHQKYNDAIGCKDDSFRWEILQKNMNHVKQDIFFINKFTSSKKLPEEIEITTFVGVINKKRKANYMTKERREPQGLYAHYTYTGEWTDYVKLGRKIYRNVLPKMNLKRRNGEDIERIQYLKSNTEKRIVTCDCYIPVSY